MEANADSTSYHHETTSPAGRRPAANWPANRTQDREQPPDRPAVYQGYQNVEPIAAPQQPLGRLPLPLTTSQSLDVQTTGQSDINAIIVPQSIVFKGLSSISPTGEADSRETRVTTFGYF